MVSCYTADGNYGNLSFMNKTKEALTLDTILKDGITTRIFVQWLKRSSLEEIFIIPKALAGTFHTINYLLMGFIVNYTEPLSLTLNNYQVTTRPNAKCWIKIMTYPEGKKTGSPCHEYLHK